MIQKETVFWLIVIFWLFLKITFFKFIDLRDRSLHSKKVEQTDIQKKQLANVQIQSLCPNQFKDTFTIFLTKREGVQIEKGALL